MTPITEPEAAEADAQERRSTVAYICDLAKKNSEALSFIPTPRLERYAAAGQVLVATENDEPCGFIVHGCGWPQMRIYQRPSALKWRLERGWPLDRALSEPRGKFGPQQAP